MTKKFIDLGKGFSIEGKLESVCPDVKALYRSESVKIRICQSSIPESSPVGSPPPRANYRMARPISKGPGVLLSP